VVKRFDFRKVLWRSEQGQTVSEYTFVLAVVFLIAVTALHYIGAQALAVFGRVANYLR
jgi:Flp pilus assembly pilin Flp